MNRIFYEYGLNATMELRHLRYFVTVAELGSVSKAAVKLFMAQPPLSAQIRQLEEEVGAALLVRLPRGVRLTPAGQSFLEDARAILARAQQAGMRARERQAGQRSTLRLGLMPSATHTLLPGLLQRLRQADPTVAVEAREMIPSARQLQALRNAEIDLGFIRPGQNQLPPEALVSIDDPYCLALHSDLPAARGRGPVQLRQVAQQAFVSFSRYVESDYFDQTAALCEEAGFTPDVRHTGGQFVSVLAMVGCGLGVAIVPASCASMAPPQVKLRRIGGTQQKSRLVMVRGEHQMQDDWGQQVIQAATDEMTALEAVIRQTVP